MLYLYMEIGRTITQVDVFLCMFKCRREVADIGKAHEKRKIRAHGFCI